MGKIGSIKVVGIGPGGEGDMTAKARTAVLEADAIVGYSTYIKLIEPLLVGTDRKIIGTGMRQEIDRCQKAVEEALLGARVAVVSGGDSGIYGMAGLVLELLLKEKEPRPAFEVVSGVSAVQAAASVLGAPLMHDFALISLSDQLTPWEIIARRLRCAAEGDFVIALYNPKSKTRQEGLAKAQAIILEYRAASTPVGIVTNAGRPGEEKFICTLGELAQAPVNMSSLVIVGNSKTYICEGYMITPRGYEEKYAP